MSSTKWLACVTTVLCIWMVRQLAAAPASEPASSAKLEESYPPMPYEYKYDVEDPEKNLYFGANESEDAQGKVIGAYRVLFPDKRLMVVEYTVEGDSGFVPKITFQDNYNPFGATNQI